jgi:hypothetical protein
MSITVEFLAGTDIRDAVTEAKQKAQEWDVAYVCFTFNGAALSIGRYADIDAAVRDWSEDRKAIIVHS